MGIAMAGGSAALNARKNADDLARARSALAAGIRFWLDLDQPDDEAWRFLEHELGIHPLALEDARRVIELPKFETYALEAPPREDGNAGRGDTRTQGHHAETRPAGPGAEGGGNAMLFVLLKTPSGSELDCFVTPRYLVTLHLAPIAWLAPMQAEVERHGFPASQERLLYRVIDRAVDEFEPVILEVERVLDAIEERLLAARHGPLPDVLRDLLSVQRRSNKLLYALEPLEQVLRRLRNPEGEASSLLNDDAVDPYWRDVQDHVSRMVGELERARDRADRILNVFLGLENRRTNVAITRLTLLTAIFAPPTLIAAIYGMNFRFMPELASPWGYPITLAAMALASALLHRYLSRQMR